MRRGGSRMPASIAGVKDELSQGGAPSLPLAIYKKGNLVRDIRHAVRRLLRDWRFSVPAVLLKKTRSACFGSAGEMRKRTAQQCARNCGRFAGNADQHVASAAFQRAQAARESGLAEHVEHDVGLASRLLGRPRRRPLPAACNRWSRGTRCRRHQTVASATDRRRAASTR